MATKKKKAKKATKPADGITVDVKELKAAMSGVSDALGPISSAMAIQDVECTLQKVANKRRLIFAASAGGAYFRKLSEAEGQDFDAAIRISSFHGIRTPAKQIRFEIAENNQIYFQSGQMKGHVPKGQKGFDKPKIFKPSIRVDAAVLKQAIARVAFKSPLYSSDPNKVAIYMKGKRLYLESHDPYMGCCCTVPCEVVNDAGPLNMFVESVFLASTIKYFEEDEILLGSNEQAFIIKDKKTLLLHPNIQRTTKQLEEKAVIDMVRDAMKAERKDTDSIEFQADGLAAAAGCSFSVAFDIETDTYHAGLVRISANKKMNLGVIETGDGLTGVSTTFDLLSIDTRKNEFRLTIADNHLKLILGALSGVDNITKMVVVDRIVVFVDKANSYYCITTQTEKSG